MAGCLMPAVAALITVMPAVVASPGVHRPFTVADEIELRLFGDPPMRASPDGRYVAALTRRGRLDLNRLEGSLRFYTTGDIERSVTLPQHAQAPAPLWIVNRSTADTGPIIHHWRWLADSSGIVFLERQIDETDRLVLAEIGSKRIVALTPAGVSVTAFDVRDKAHYVYTTAPPLQDEAARERKAVAIPGIGKGLFQLLFPVDEHPQMTEWNDRAELWAVIAGQRLQVGREGRPLVLFGDGRLTLSLSPDGGSVVTALPVANVPHSWEFLYPPPLPSAVYRVRAGPQDLATTRGDNLVHEYVLVELKTGIARSLTHGPTGRSAGWKSVAAPDWSDDGRHLLLPDALFESRNEQPTRPCLAMLDLSARRHSCIEIMKIETQTGYEEGWHIAKEARFVRGDPRQIVFTYYADDLSVWTKAYRRDDRGRWQSALPLQGIPVVAGRSTISIQESLNQSPRLVAVDNTSGKAFVIDDPGSDIVSLDLGVASTYRWQDDSGRNWMGGLYEPTAPYRSPHPLVIQTHGFTPHEFKPSGAFTTAFAARALAAAEIAVLQVQDCPYSATAAEPACNVRGYESAVRRLASEGLIDPDRVGLIGFSRSCIYVMEALTRSAVRFRAASVTDGEMLSYMQYMTRADFGDMELNEAEVMLAGKPFGEGLRRWLERSPTFNMDKVSAPLLVVALGRPSLLTMWEPYAALRYLHKPVELMLLNSTEHELTNPAARVVSQRGSVDWFGFWLRGYADPDPAKAASYARWHKFQTR